MNDENKWKKFETKKDGSTSFLNAGIIIIIVIIIDNRRFVS
jgi:hypothetical protein